MLESTQDLVVFVNLDQTVSHLNEAARRALGGLEQIDYTSFEVTRFLTDKGQRLIEGEGFPVARSTGGHWRGGEVMMRSLRGGPDSRAS